MRLNESIMCLYYVPILEEACVQALSRAERAVEAAERRHAERAARARQAAEALRAREKETIARLGGGLAAGRAADALRWLDRLREKLREAEAAQANRAKHGIGFTEATELLESKADHLEFYDDEHSVDEDRFIAIGPIRSGVMVVVWTERDRDTARIISARWATQREIELYRSYMEAR